MIIIPIKEGESIERPLKDLKESLKTQGLKQLRARRYFTKKVRKKKRRSFESIL